MWTKFNIAAMGTAVALSPGIASAGPQCQLELAAADEAGLCGGGGGGGGGDRVCTAALPIPADAFDCACKTINLDPGRRCSEPLPQDTCNTQINNALAFGLITSNAVTFLRNNGFCPLVIDLGTGPRIFDFCPAGCFAADTRILTSVPGAREVGYTPASEITPQHMLMSMADESSYGSVTVTARSIKRAVHGSEKPPLYVFALANGSVLRVTQHHPMVIDTGQVVAANQVDLRMSFVGLDGAPVAIASIAREQTTSDVFNFLAAGDTQLEHVIVAEGVLVGDLQLQNELAAEQASIELRR